MNPYSGTSTLAKVRTRGEGQGRVLCHEVGKGPPSVHGRCARGASPPKILANHLSVQTLRVGAFGLGLVYGSIKLASYKAGAGLGAVRACLGRAGCGGCPMHDVGTSMPWKSPAPPDFIADDSTHVIPQARAAVASKTSGSH